LQLGKTEQLGRSGIVVQILGRQKVRARVGQAGEEGVGVEGGGDGIGGGWRADEGDIWVM